MRNTSVTFWNRLPLSISATLVIGVFSGCYPFRDGYRYFPPGAIPPPAGTHTRHWQTAQVDKAHRGGLVLNEASWIDGTDRLGPAAIDRLSRNEGVQCEPIQQVTLEPADDPILNDRRKQVISDLMAKNGIELSPDSIVLGTSDSNILQGEESLRIAREMMQGNQNGNNQNGFGGGTNPGGFLGGPNQQGFGGFPGDYFGGRQ